MKKKLTKQSKLRLDVLLVKKGLAESREKAQAYILSRHVLSGDKLFTKPGEQVLEDIEIRIKNKNNYVSRGAHKLKHALEHFQINLKGKTCLDVGASTGGFTQVCLEKGAVKVYALDVGVNQLDWKLRQDPRVIAMEGINIRYASRDVLLEKVDFICIDTSFISLKLVLPAVQCFLKSNALGLALIKPQHEVGKDQVGKGGIVNDPKLHERVAREITEFIQRIGFKVKGLIESPIKGFYGNKEFLISFQY